MKKIFLSLGLLLTFVLYLGNTLAFAQGLKDFDAKSFKAAQDAGKIVLLDFYAAWCPTCKRQKPVIESLLTQPEYKDFVAFSVDYDNSDDLQKSLSVRRQSTVILFKGNAELARSIGETDKEDLESLLKKAL